MSEHNVEDRVGQQAERQQTFKEKFPWYVEEELHWFDVIMVITWAITLIGYSIGLLVKYVL